MSVDELPVPVDRIKKEKVTPPPSPTKELETKLEDVTKIFREPSPEDSQAKIGAPDENNPSEAVEEKIQAEPVKTSDEILLELFQVFNAAPPDDTKSRKKKHKKHKKKSKKKKRDGLSDISDSEDEAKGEKRKKVKVKKEKRSRSRSREKSPKTKDRSSKKADGEVKKERRDSSENADKTSGHKRAPSSKIVIKDLRDSKILVEASKAKSPQTEKRKRRASSSLSLSDEETFERERQARETKESRTTRRSPSRDRNRDRDREKDSFRSSYKEARRRHSPAVEDMRERIDKKKLLEIARKNAMQMMKSGQLPGNTLRELEKARFGGKSITELTNFCKKLSNGEILSDLSSLSSGDSDHDREGNTKAFHHPFVLKDRGPIVLNIRNSVPLPTRTVDQTNAVLQAFPVSSGQQHRQSEMEWVPVEAPKAITAAPEAVTPGPAAAKAIKKDVPVTVPTVPAPGPAIVPPVAQIPPVGGPAITAPPFAQPPPAPLPSGPQMNHPPAFVTYPPLRNYGNAAHSQPLAPPPMPSGVLSDSVFPKMTAPPPMDVSTIISQRLNAMRKLQENPNDNSAMRLMETSQKEMSSWAASKFTPGRFMGSTGANILTAKQLSGGNQAWAKKDAFTSCAPLSGGKGMSLLQKMGWKPGEALGKEKTGSLEPLLLEVKLDRKGLIAEEEGQQKQPKKKNPMMGGSRNMKMSQQFMESKHPVSLLGELASKKKWSPPYYELVHESGPHHHKCFVYQVVLNSMAYTPAVPCTTKKEAKKMAAQVCLEQLGILPTMSMPPPPQPPPNPC